MPRSGHDPWSCLSFDVACVEYETAYEREANRTVEVPVPKGKRRATMPVPAHKPDVLLRLQGIDPRAAASEGLEIDEQTKEMAASVLTGEADWLLNPG